jgi:hypothetical protein
VSSRFQEAFALALVSEEARAELRADPAGFAAKRDLDAEETERLAAAVGVRLELTAQVGYGKRVELLRRALPLTVKGVERLGRHEVLAEFARTTRTEAKEGVPHRVLMEARAFSEFVERSDALSSSFVGDLVRFEVMRLELLGSAAATDAAARPALEPERARSVVATPGDAAVVRGPHVRVAVFDRDVMRLCETLAAGEEDVPDAPPEPTGVTMVKRLARPSIALYRTGPATVALFERCAEPARIADVLAESPPEVAHVLVAALSDGALTLV